MREYARRCGLFVRYRAALHMPKSPVWYISAVITLEVDVRTLVVGIEGSAVIQDRLVRPVINTNISVPEIPVNKAWLDAAAFRLHWPEQAWDHFGQDLLFESFEFRMRTLDTKFPLHDGLH